MNKLNPHSESKLKVATSVVRKEEKEGALFYILPPLLVVAVFAFCALSEPPTLVRDAGAQGISAAPEASGESGAPSAPTGDVEAGEPSAAGEVAGAEE